MKQSQLKQNQIELPSASVFKSVYIKDLFSNQSDVLHTIMTSPDISRLKDKFTF